jgi:hypothetical protein
MPSIRKYAAELVALAPDVVLAAGGGVVRPLLDLTSTVPIVFSMRSTHERGTAAGTDVGAEGTSTITVGVLTR